MKRSTYIVLYAVAIISFFATCYSVIYLNKKVELYNESMNAKQVLLKQDNGFLMWKYDDEDSNWAKLYNLSGLKGKDGADGKDGINGLNGTNGANGKDGIDGLNGKDGANGKNGIDGLNGKDGADGKDGINGLNGTNGIDGREVEFRVNGNIVQWKYVGTNEWNDLLNINTAINTAKNNIVNSVNGNSNDLGCYTDGTICSPGTIMDIRVNDSENYEFYVINDDGQNVTLVSKNNIGKNEITTTAWYSGMGGNDISVGPSVVLGYLGQIVDNWTNIDIISDYNYDNSGEGYKKVIITNGVAKTINASDNDCPVEGVFRARLLTFEEITILGCTTTAGSCPSWLYENMDGTIFSLHPDGYWLLTTYTSATGAYTINRNGSLSSSNVGDSSLNGIRPVITINK